MGAALEAIGILLHALPVEVSAEAAHPVHPGEVLAAVETPLRALQVEALEAAVHPALQVEASEEAAHLAPLEAADHEEGRAQGNYRIHSINQQLTQPL